MLKLSLVRSLSYTNTITFLAVWLRGWHYYLFYEKQNFRSSWSPINKGLLTPQVTSLYVFTPDYVIFKHYMSHSLSSFSGLCGLASKHQVLLFHPNLIFLKSNTTYQVVLSSTRYHSEWRIVLNKYLTYNTYAIS